jgi:hypothetical protein
MTERPRIEVERTDIETLGPEVLLRIRGGVLPSKPSPGGLGRTGTGTETGTETGTAAEAGAASAPAADLPESMDGGAGQR